MCNTCGGGFSYFEHSAPYTDNRPIGDCGFTKEIINYWFEILQCVKTQSKWESLQLSLFDVNSYLGIIQSAINYPDNYCYYSDKLTIFKDTILPKIIDNVPECI